MSGEVIAFMILGFMAIAGAVMMINLTKVMHMMIALVLTFVSVAGIFLLLSAEFAAVVQIMIYSGAITIIMLFGIMLTNHQDESPSKVRPLGKAMILLGILGFAAVVYAGIYNLDFGTVAGRLHADNTEKIGISIFSEYVIPFELLSVLLLVGLVGAIVLAKKDEKEEGDS